MDMPRELQSRILADRRRHVDDCVRSIVTDGRRHVRRQNDRIANWMKRYDEAKQRQSA